MRPRHGCRQPFDRKYARVNWASVPLERLLKASHLIALYSVRNERAFCEEPETAAGTSG